MKIQRLSLILCRYNSPPSQGNNSIPSIPELDHGDHGMYRVRPHNRYNTPSPSPSQQVCCLSVACFFLGIQWRIHDFRGWGALIYYLPLFFRKRHENETIGLGGGHIPRAPRSATGLSIFETLLVGGGGGVNYSPL